MDLPCKVQMVFRTSLLGHARPSVPVQVLRVQLVQFRISKLIEATRLAFVAPGKPDEHEDDEWQVNDFTDKPQCVPSQLLVTERIREPAKHGLGARHMVKNLSVEAQEDAGHSV